MTSALVRWLVLASLCCFVVPAHADDLVTRTAKRHYERGEKLFALGKFDQALDEYQQAFDAKPLGDFLYNIGQCYRNLSDYNQAIFSFKKYLKLKPEADDRDKVERLIEELEEKRQRGEGEKFAPKPDPVEPPPSQQAQTPIYKQWWFWTGLAVVGAGGVGIYEATKRSGPPTTDLGNIGRVFSW
jgi:tetratricopeptide (TPR) repeat protein